MQRPDNEATSNRWRTGKAILGLGTTQVIGWGSIFNSLSLVAQPISDDLSISRPMVFVGVTVMLLVSALVAPRLGRLVDRFGARPMMAVGSLVMAAGLLVLAVSHGLVMYLFAWAILGIATPMALTQTAMPGLVQVVGPSARRAITGLTLINGLSSTFMLPLMEAMLSTWGWRTTFVGLAALNAFICMPMHLAVLSRGPPTRPGGTAGSGHSWNGVLPQEYRQRALILIAIWSCMEGLVTWGLYMQAIDMFSAQGIPRSAAIGIWMLVGPMQALARFVDLILGNRFSINNVALLSAFLVMASFAVLLPYGVSIATATGFAFVIGVGHGLFAIARNMLPLTLFGQREYGAYMGRLMLPQNIFNAGAPVAFAAIISQYGPTTALWLTWASSTIALLSVIALTRYCRAATMGMSSPRA